MIHLYVGNLQVDWGKNRGFTDHSGFFQANDVAAVPYYYVADGSEYVDANGETQWKLSVVYNEGLSKPLAEVKGQDRASGPHHRSLPQRVHVSRRAPVSPVQSSAEACLRQQ
ncbi:MAG: hypothetical protein JO134_16495 [Xanthobacteraceae bacterium]|nr:hypothetical protein [Xanthobacteraceae bacterium]